MVSKEKQIDILSPKGEVLFRLNIKETEGNPSNQTISSNETKETKSSISNGELMTDAQKKFIFRICGSRGMKGESIHSYMKKFFGVNDLKEVTKQEASGMIEQLLAENNGGNGNGSSIKQSN
jgi:hypothetical protein